MIPSFLKTFLESLLVIGVLLLIFFGLRYKPNQPITEPSYQPEGFIMNTNYTYPLDAQTTIRGIQFTIPPSLSEGTNLGSGSYISIEKIPNKTLCTPNDFLATIQNNYTLTENQTTWKVASAMDAGAGNRYEEYVYLPHEGTSCTAVRYFIHYAAIENFEPGTVTAFDKQSLMNTFDEIRNNLLTSQAL